MKSVARNEPCPCGSGSKYKNCCLPNDMQAQTDSDDVSPIKATAFKKMSDRQWDEEKVVQRRQPELPAGERQRIQEFVHEFSEHAERATWDALP